MEQQQHMYNANQSICTLVKTVHVEPHIFFLIQTIHMIACIMNGRCARKQNSCWKILTLWFSPTKSKTMYVIVLQQAMGQMATSSDWRDISLRLTLTVHPVMESYEWLRLLKGEKNCMMAIQTLKEDGKCNMMVLELTNDSCSDGKSCNNLSLKYLKTKCKIFKHFQHV